MYLIGIIVSMAANDSINHYEVRGDFRMKETTTNILQNAQL